MELLEQGCVDIRADQPLPNANSHKKLVRDNPEMNLPQDDNALKRWNSFETYEKINFNECVKYYKRTKITDIYAAAASFLKKKKKKKKKKKRWLKDKKKQIDACRTKLRNAKTEEDLAKRFKSTGDEAVEEQIKDQSWPNVRLTQLAFFINL